MSKAQSLDLSVMLGCVIGYCLIPEGECHWLSRALVGTFTAGYALRMVLGYLIPIGAYK